MIIEDIGGVIKITAEEGKKLTNHKRTFFSEMVYLAKGDNANNYKEVGKEVWSQGSEDKELSTLIKKLTKRVNDLEEFALNSDYRSLLKDKGEHVEDPYKDDESVIFALLKHKISKSKTPNDADIVKMLNDYYSSKRISYDSYTELLILLSK
jgi:hypothetical protein